MNYSQLDLELFKIFGRKELTEGCYYYPNSDDFAEVYKLISDKEYCIKYIRISDGYFGSFLTDEEWCNEILGHEPTITDVFRVAEKKVFTIIVDGDSIRIFNIRRQTEYIEEYNPAIPLLSQPDETKKQLIDLFQSQ